jgi:hypothetical protein
VPDRHETIRSFVAQPELGPDRMTVRHPFSPQRSRPFDPFLYLAHFGPKELHATQWGFGPHPHRGFETVTYLLAGEIEHRDSFGAEAIIGPGDVQWMTAAAGIVHAEMPPERFARSGGPVEGFQVWVNLPAAKKMIAPGFAVLRAADMPRGEPAPGVTLRAIGGEMGGVRSPVATQSPLLIAHATLAPGAVWTFAKRAGWTLFTYDFKGAAVGRTDWFERADTEVSLGNPDAVARDLLIFAGEPLNEPIASHGPFVMNTREQLVEAVRDYQSGRMGRLE